MQAISQEEKELFLSNSNCSEEIKQVLLLNNISFYKDGEIIDQSYIDYYVDITIIKKLILIGYQLYNRFGHIHIQLIISFGAIMPSLMEYTEESKHNINVYGNYCKYPTSVKILVSKYKIVGYDLIINRKSGVITIIDTNNLLQDKDLSKLNIIKSENMQYTARYKLFADIMNVVIELAKLFPELIRVKKAITD